MQENKNIKQGDDKSDGKISIMVVDDSGLIRTIFKKNLEAQDDMQVIAAAKNGEEAIELARQHASELNIITLDINMPVMDGLTALPQIIKIAPEAKVIIVSSTSIRNSENTIKALANGATDYIAKPTTSGDGNGLDTILEELNRKIRAIAHVNISKKPSPRIVTDSIPTASTEKPAKDVNNNKNISSTDIKDRNINNLTKPEPTSTISSDFVLNKMRQSVIPSIFAIGSSTGGPNALNDFFTALKGKKFNMPVIITQHMPAGFTKALANQITESSGLKCKEGEDGEKLIAGTIYIAPGDYHMTIQKDISTGGEIVKLDQKEKENFCRPSVDPMLRSLPKIYGKNILIMILTGMGHDGLEGAKQLVSEGATLIAQDEKSSVVWGMPGAVAKAGICHKVKPLSELPQSILDLAGGKIV